MKFGHYSNEELGIKRNITCSMFESKGVGVGDAQCSTQPLKGQALRKHLEDLFNRSIGYCRSGKVDWHDYIADYVNEFESDGSTAKANNVLTQFDVEAKQILQKVQTKDFPAGTDMQEAWIQMKFIIANNRAALKRELRSMRMSNDIDDAKNVECAITDNKLGKAIRKKVFAAFGQDFANAKKVALIRIRRILLAGNKKSSWVHLYNDFLPKLEAAIKEAGTFKVKGVEERVPARQLREIGRAIEDEFCEMIDAATEQVKKELKKEGVKVDNLGKALKLSNMIDKEMAEGDEEADNAKDAVCYNTEAASKWSDRTINLYGIDAVRKTAREGHAAAEKGEQAFKAWLDKKAQELRAAKEQLRSEVSDGYDYAKLVHHIDSFAIQVSAKLARDCIHHNAKRLDRMCSNRIEKATDVACEMPSKPIMRIITDARKEMAQNDKLASELEKKLNAANEYDQELESAAYDFLNVRTQKQKDRIAQIQRMDKKGLVNIDELEQECEQNASSNFLQVRKALKAYKARAKKNRK